MYTVATAVFLSCAVGVMMAEDMIDKSKFDIITGLANKQMGASSQDGEIEIARQLAGTGVVFVLEWVYNVALFSPLGRARI